MTINWIQALQCSVLAVIGIVASSAQSATNSPIVVTTIEEVNVEPVSFHRTTIRVRCVVDECYGFHCEICSTRDVKSKDEETHCLVIGFDIRSDPTLPPWKQEEFYRFTDITAEGSYDADCKVGYDADRYRAPPPSI